MSTAEHFKFRGRSKTAPFPWCVESMSATDIDALGFVRIFQGTLADITAEFWNREWLSLGFVGSGGLASAERPVVVAGVTPLTATESTEPRDRVCADEYLGIDSQPIDPPLWAQTNVITDGTYEFIVRFFYRTVVYDTDAMEYVILGTVELCSDDGAGKIMTSDSSDPAFPNVSSGYLDLFVSGPGVYNMYYGSTDYAVPVVLNDPVVNDALWSY